MGNEGENAPDITRYRDVQRACEVLEVDHESLSQTDLQTVIMRHDDRNAKLRAEVRDILKRCRSGDNKPLEFKRIRRIAEDHGFPLSVLGTNELELFQVERIILCRGLADGWVDQILTNVQDLTLRQSVTWDDIDERNVLSHICLIVSECEQFYVNLAEVGGISVADLCEAAKPLAVVAIRHLRRVKRRRDHGGSVSVDPRIEKYQRIFGITEDELSE